MQIQRHLEPAHPLPLERFREPDGPGMFRYRVEALVGAAARAGYSLAKVEHIGRCALA